MPILRPDKLDEKLLNRSDPVFSVPELARELEASDTKIRQVLEALEVAGRVERKDVGARATAWWHVERVRPPVGTSEEPDPSPAEPQADTQDGTDAPVSVERAMQIIDLPGSGEKLERRRDAFRALLEKLRSADGPTNELYGPTFENFDTGYQSVESWRTNAAGPELSRLSERGFVECDDESAGQWRWLGE